MKKEVIKQREQRTKWQQFAYFVAGCMRYLLIMTLASVIILGQVVWDVSNIVVADNLVLSWLFLVVRLSLFGLLVYWVLTFSQINTYGAISSLLAIAAVVVGYEHAGFILKLSYTAFGIGALIRLLEIVFSFDSDEKVESWLKILFAKRKKK